MTLGVILLLANAASTFALLGLIWTIQLVHYPTFHYVTPDRFTEFEAFHQRRISWIVVPLMLVELVTSLALLQWHPPSFSIVWAGVGVAFVALIWITTFTLQIPLHNKLSHGYDKQAISALVAGNWVRTLAWTLRGLLILWGIAVMMIGAQG